MLGSTVFVGREREHGIVGRNPHAAVLIPCNVGDPLFLDVGKCRDRLETILRGRIYRQSVGNRPRPEVTRIVRTEAIDVIGRHPRPASILDPVTSFRIDTDDPVSVGRNPYDPAADAADIEYARRCEGRLPPQPHVERRELPGRRFDINSRPRTDPQIPVRILPQREHAVVGKQRQRIPVDLAHAMAFLVVAPYTRTPRRKAQFRSGVPPDYGIDGRSIRQHTQVGMLPVADDTAAAGIIPDQPEIEQPEPIFALADVIHTPYGTGVEAGTHRIEPVEFEFHACGLYLADAAAQHPDPHEVVPGPHNRIDLVVWQVAHILAGFEILERGPVIRVMQDTQSAAGSHPQRVLRNILFDGIDNVVEQRRIVVFTVHVTGILHPPGSIGVYQADQSRAPCAHPDIPVRIAEDDMRMPQDFVVIRVGTFFAEIVAQQSAAVGGDPQAAIGILDDRSDVRDELPVGIAHRNRTEIMFRGIFPEQAFVASDPYPVTRIADNDRNVAIVDRFAARRRDRARLLVEPEQPAFRPDPDHLVAVFGHDIHERIERHARNVVHTVSDHSVPVIPCQAVIGRNPDIPVGILIELAHFARRQDVGRDRLEPDFGIGFGRHVPHHGKHGRHSCKKAGKYQIRTHER